MFKTLYSYGERLAGELGKDLVHHCYIKCSSIDANSKQAYLLTVMRNEWYNKKSEFHRLYGNETTIQTDIEEEISDVNNYDSITLHTVLLSIENDGYKDEVFVFKQCYLHQSQISFSKTSGINLKTVKKICNFVKTKIKEKYDN